MCGMLGASQIPLHSPGDQEGRPDCWEHTRYSDSKGWRGSLEGRAPGLTDHAPPLRPYCQDACVNIWDYFTIPYGIMKFIFPALVVMCWFILCRTQGACGTNSVHRQRHSCSRTEQGAYPTYLEQNFRLGLRRPQLQAGNLWVRQGLHPFFLIHFILFLWLGILLNGVEKAQAKGLSTGPPRPRGRESRKRSERTSHASYRTSLLGQVVFWGLAVPLPLLELLQEALASQAVSISYSQRASFGESLPGPLISVLLNGWQRPVTPSPKSQRPL